MLPKTPKPAVWRFIKGSAKTLFVLEAVCFAASYGLYYRMNTNQGEHYLYKLQLQLTNLTFHFSEFRQYINENYPFALDYYYKIGEIVGDSNIRQTDASYWSSQAAQFNNSKRE
ncbi:hypothetical protein KR044_013369 [Drosophila immigrans]|nr:hypothetical protein KR044_013369 [Drosophila immigrans]